MGKINIKKDCIEFIGNDYSIDLNVNAAGITFSSGSTDYFTITNDSKVYIGNEITISKDGIKYSNIESGSFSNHNILSKGHVNQIVNESVSKSLKYIQNYIQELFDAGEIVSGPENELILGNGKTIKSYPELNFKNGVLSVTGSIKVTGDTISNISGKINIQNPPPVNSNTTNGKIGDISFDDNFIYIKTKKGWKRSVLNIF